MSGKRQAAEESGWDRIAAVLDAAPFGLHLVGPGLDEVPAQWPSGLQEMIRAWNGASLFLESIELLAARDITRTPSGRWLFGSVDGDDVSVSDDNRVWRFDSSIDDDIIDGTRLDRWLGGVLDAAALVFDGEGEYFEDAFDDEGQLRPELEERQLRAQLRRDARAPGPRWRLARRLLAAGQVDLARRELESTVADDPTFAWAWLDLARVSETLGEGQGACDEALAAARAGQASSYTGYFWAQTARLASALGDEALRQSAAASALGANPQLKNEQLRGARESLASGDLATAIGLAACLRAIAPRDLEVLELTALLAAATTPRQ
jgi:hypothetical protein